MCLFGIYFSVEYNNYQLICIVSDIITVHTYYIGLFYLYTNIYSKLEDPYLAARAPTIVTCLLRAQVFVTAQHSWQRRERLCLPGHLPDDTSQPGRRGFGFDVFLRRGRLLVPSERRPKGDVYQNTARVQKPGGRGQLAPLHRAVPRAAKRAPLRHVRHIDVTHDNYMVSLTSIHLCYEIVRHLLWRWCRRYLTQYIYTVFEGI